MYVSWNGRLQGRTVSVGPAPESAAGRLNQIVEATTIAQCLFLQEGPMRQNRDGTIVAADQMDDVRFFLRKIELYHSSAKKKSEF